MWFSRPFAKLASLDEWPIPPVLPSANDIFVRQVCIVRKLSAYRQIFHYRPSTDKILWTEGSRASQDWVKEVKPPSVFLHWCHYFHNLGVSSADLCFIQSCLPMFAADTLGKSDGTYENPNFCCFKHISNLSDKLLKYIPQFRFHNLGLSNLSCSSCF